MHDLSETSIVIRGNCHESAAFARKVNLGYCIIPERCSELVLERRHLLEEFLVINSCEFAVVSSSPAIFADRFGFGQAISLSVCRTHLASWQEKRVIIIIMISLWPHFLGCSSRLSGLKLLLQLECIQHKQRCSSSKVSTYFADEASAFVELRHRFKATNNQWHSQPCCSTEVVHSNSSPASHEA